MASPRRRPRRSPLLTRALVACCIGLVLFLYYRPVRSYLSTAEEVAARRAEVQRLRVQKHVLERRLALSSTRGQLAREARRIGYVKPGERLYIVKGIDAWRVRQVAAAHLTASR